MKQLSPTDTNIIQAIVFWDVSPYGFIQYHMTLLPHIWDSYPEQRDSRLLQNTGTYIYILRGISKNSATWYK